VVGLKKRRDKLVEQVRLLDKEIAKYAPELIEDSPSGAKRGKVAAKRGRKGKVVAARGKKPLGRGDFSNAVREVFTKAGAPLRAKDVVDGLPGAGIKVDDVADMRKRVSVVLASQKNHFQQVERGVYQLRD
ncbi:MAG: hypothetical protein LIP23_06845, partial [Planctomycetes bacterium]|nr:hypothetical protein [Planctomycetota bacterium]